MNKSFAFIKRIFSVKIYDYSIVMNLLGFKVTLSCLYNLLFGNPLLTNCSILQNLSDLKAKGTKFPHPVGIVIAPEVVIGKNCTIMQNVTLGNSGGASGLNGYPTIGDNVLICAGAVVVGNIKIGNNSVIAANAVVKTDVDANVLVAGVPAKLKKNYGRK